MIPANTLHELTQSVNFPGFFITNIRFATGRLHLYLSRRFHSARCSSCGCYCGQFYDSRKRRFRDVDWGHTRVYINIRRVRLQCPRCGVTAERLPFAAPGASFTNRFTRAIGRMCQFTTRKDTAFLFSVSEDSVGRYEWSLLQQIQFDMLRRRPRIKRLQFDEIAKRKGHNYVTVFRDCQTGKVVGVVDGRKKEDVRPFFESLRAEECNQIEAVCIDMSRSYIAAVREYCPNATLVFDRFHVVKHLNEALYTVAKSEKMKQPEKLQVRWKRFSRALGKNPENLTEKQMICRNFITSQSSLLSAAYDLKEKFRGLWEKRTLRGAKIFLTRWLKSAKELGHGAFREFAEMVERHRREILNYYKFQLTNGPQEGLNNKLNVIRRKAYGYANVDWYSMKIIQSTHQKIKPFSI